MMRKVAHAFSGALGIEIGALEHGHDLSDWLRWCERLEGGYFGVNKLGDVDGDVAAVALGPTFLPKVARYFCYLVDYGLKSGVIVLYTHVCVESVGLWVEKHYRNILLQELRNETAGNEDEQSEKKYGHG